MRIPYTRTLIAIICLTLLLAVSFKATTTQSPILPGGFLEKATSSDVRPLLTAAEIQSFLPPRGATTGC